MNLNPAVWGSHAWFFLESIVIGMPEKLSGQEKMIYKNFFSSLEFLLPCTKCREHFHENLIKYPLTDEILSSKDSMMKWIVDMHNQVRIAGGQREKTVDEVISFYKDAYNTEKNEDSNTQEHSLLLIFIIVIAVIFFMHRNKIMKYLSK